jgi:hypothetical protein
LSGWVKIDKKNPALTWEYINRLKSQCTYDFFAGSACLVVVLVLETVAFLGSVAGCAVCCAGVAAGFTCVVSAVLVVVVVVAEVAAGVILAGASVLVGCVCGCFVVSCAIATTPVSIIALKNKFFMCLSFKF